VSASLSTTSPPLTSRLNNWLSRGDILAELVRHLLRCHPDWVLAVTLECLAELSLAAHEDEVARLRWREGLPLEVIAERTNCPLSEVSGVLDETVRLLAPLVTSRVKAQLHATRRRS